ncbi:MAG TPA: isoprenylcysteine carboxylmethyltransferase family protein [Gemmatimonadales bacterium]|nr:isoprenylcysteine carboxylmethyltransferase family protein [Gemmatimonadales bacterium]
MSFPGFWLFIRSIIAIIVLPGFITGYAPWRWFRLAAVDLSTPNLPQGAALAGIAAGAGILLTCVWEFARSGRGTLAPIDPPKRLVVQGLYRYVRNPMYVGVLLILLGELGLVRTTTFLAYTLCFVVAVNVFVIGYEEPALRRMFGDEYRSYCARVHRWIPTLPASE